MEFMVYVHTSPENQRTQLLKFREKYSGNE